MAPADGRVRDIFTSMMVSIYRGVMEVIMSTHNDEGEVVQIVALSPLLGNIGSEIKRIVGINAGESYLRQ